MKKILQLRACYVLSLIGFYFSPVRGMEPNQDAIKVNFLNNSQVYSGQWSKADLEIFRVFKELFEKTDLDNLPLELKEVNVEFFKKLLAFKELSPGIVFLKTESVKNIGALLKVANQFQHLHFDHLCSYLGKEFLSPIDAQTAFTNLRWLEGENLKEEDMLGADEQWHISQSVHEKMWDMIRKKMERPLDQRFSNQPLAVDAGVGIFLPTFKKTFVGAYETSKLYALDQKNGKPLNSFQAKGIINALACNDEGTLIASGGSSGKVQLWKVENESLTFFKEFDLPILNLTGNPNGWLYALAFKPGTENIVVYVGHDSPYYWDMENNMYHSLGEVASFDLSFNKKGTLLALADDKKCRVIDMATLELWGNFEHDSCVSALSFDPSQERIVVGEQAGKVCLWNIHTKEKIKTFEHSQRITSLAFNWQGNLLAVREYDGKLWVWDIENKKCLQEEMLGSTQCKLRFIYPARSVEWSRKGKLLVAGNHHFHIFNYLTEKEVESYKNLAFVQKLFLYYLATKKLSKNNESTRQFKKLWKSLPSKIKDRAYCFFN